MEGISYKGPHPCCCTRSLPALIGGCSLWGSEDCLWGMGSQSGAPFPEPGGRRVNKERPSGRHPVSPGTWASWHRRLPREGLGAEVPGRGSLLRDERACSHWAWAVSALPLLCLLRPLEADRSGLLCLKQTPTHPFCLYRIEAQFDPGGFSTVVQTPRNLPPLWLKGILAHVLVQPASSLPLHVCACVHAHPLLLLRKPLPAAKPSLALFRFSAGLTAPPPPCGPWNPPINKHMPIHYRPGRDVVFSMLNYSRHLGSLKFCWQLWEEPGAKPRLKRRI